MTYGRVHESTGTPRADRFARWEESRRQRFQPGPDCLFVPHGYCTHV